MEKEIGFGPIFAIDTTSFYIGSTIISRHISLRFSLSVLHATAGQIDSENICIYKFHNYSRTVYNALLGIQAIGNK